jgi:hypothetical protein
MTHETLERMARDLATEVSLPAEDWEAVVAQAAAMQTWIKSLDELPLQDVEPASVAGILSLAKEQP